MIITLSGITGVGKSYIKNRIAKDLNFKKIAIVTTREKRSGEKNGIDKIFISNKEFQNLENQNQILVSFDFLGNKYAYLAKDLNEENNSVTELHYSTITEFKKEAQDVISIYIKPKNIEMAKKQLKRRKLSKDIEESRLAEIEEQIKTFEQDEEMQSKFDYIFYNDYTEKSVQNILKFIRQKSKQNLLCTY